MHADGFGLYDRAMKERRFAVAAGALAAAGAIVVLACGENATTSYGNPSGLSHANLPGEAGISALVCDAGALEGGAAPTDGGCAVSWSADIAPKMAAAGAWKCASGGKCHGAQQAPLLDAATPAALYASLQAATVNGNPYPYLNPDSGDPTQSSIECNLAQACGNGMPLAPGTPLTPGELCAIDTWVRCGAPQN